jgi:major membrane immunogen (membrane-anchored lipoprotein)
MKRLGYSVLIVCLAINWLLPACGNEEVTSKTLAEERYAKQLEDKEITENPSQVLTPDEGNKGTVKGQLEAEQQAEEMMERDEENRHQ